MLIPSSTRHRMLLCDWGCSMQSLMTATKDSQKVQELRNETLNETMSEWMMKEQSMGPFRQRRRLSSSSSLNALGQTGECSNYKPKKSSSTSSRSVYNKSHHPSRSEYISEWLGV